MRTSRQSGLSGRPRGRIYGERRTAMAIVARRRRVHGAMAIDPARATLTPRWPSTRWGARRSDRRRDNSEGDTQETGSCSQSPANVAQSSGRSWEFPGLKSPNAARSLIAPPAWLGRLHGRRWYARSTLGTLRAISLTASRTVSDDGIPARIAITNTESNLSSLSAKSARSLRRSTKQSGGSPSCSQTAPDGDQASQLSKSRPTSEPSAGNVHFSCDFLSHPKRPKETDRFDLKSD